MAPAHVWIDAPAGVGLWGPSNAPVLSPSRGSQGLRNLENRARTRMITGVQRIVTISCTDSDDAHWRRPLAHGNAKNRWRSDHASGARCLAGLQLHCWHLLPVREHVAHTEDSGAGRKLVSTANARPGRRCQCADSVELSCNATSSGIPRRVPQVALPHPSAA